MHEKYCKDMTECKMFRCNVTSVILGFKKYHYQKWLVSIWIIFQIESVMHNE